MFPFTHLQTYQMSCTHHDADEDSDTDDEYDIHHPYQNLHLRHRPTIPIHSHQFHLLPSVCIIGVLVETRKRDSTFLLVELRPLVGIYH